MVNNPGKCDNCVHNQSCDCGTSWGKWLDRRKDIEGNKKGKGGILYLRKNEKKGRTKQNRTEINLLKRFQIDFLNELK